MGFFSNIISAFDVMQTSDKSYFFTVLNNSSFNLILTSASKLEPISFSALFISILAFVRSLILMILFQSFEIVLFFQLAGIFGNVFK